MMHSIAFLLVPDFEMLDMAGPLSVFQTANEFIGARGRSGYQLVLVSQRGGRLRSSSGAEVLCRPLREVQANTLIAVGGWGARQPGAVTPGLMRYLQSHAHSKRRLASVCTGAFLLAVSGLLDGRRVTTHWRLAATLQRQHPLVKVDIDRIFVRDGDVWTSAGITAGIDLALAMVESDFGSDIAAETAREMVVYHRRTGGQSQFSALQDLLPGSERMRDVLTYIREHLEETLDIEQLASVACVSSRQFIRAFKAETGLTPAKAVERIRAEAAKLLIEQGDSRIDRVAGATGFGDEERMRRAFIRVYGQPPQALRRQAKALR